MGIGYNNLKMNIPMRLFPVGDPIQNNIDFLIDSNWTKYGVGS